MLVKDDKVLKMNEVLNDEYVKTVKIDEVDYQILIEIYGLERICFNDIIKKVNINEDELVRRFAKYYTHNFIKLKDTTGSNPFEKEGRDRVKKYVEDNEELVHTYSEANGNAKLPIFLTLVYIKNNRIAYLDDEGKNFVQRKIIPSLVTEAKSLSEKANKKINDFNKEIITIISIIFGERFKIRVNLQNGVK